jgi:prepilin-type N-terminal cleavage/methylation domain-containing protein
MRNKRSGFTLVEALMVVFIMGILAAIALPRLDLFGGKATYITARQLVSDIRYTRNLSVTTGRQYYLKLLPAGGPYTSYDIYQRNSPALDTIINTKEISNKVNCTSTLGELRFRYLGDLVGNISPIELITIERIDDGAKTYVHIISASGRAYESNEP